MKQLPEASGPAPRAPGLAAVEARPRELDEHGYCYDSEEHFDETMNRVARESLRRSIEHRVAQLAIGLFALGSLGLFFKFDQHLGGLLLIAALVVLYLSMTRETRLAKRIERERLCFTCAYPLFEEPVDDTGRGRCPGCGAPYLAAWYRRPPPMYETAGAD